jgi:gas vesicle protein
MSENRTNQTLLAFGIGLAAGAAIALLLAPASGEETRRRLGQFGRTAGERAKEGADLASSFVRDQAKRFGHAFEEGKRAYREETTES